MELVVATFNLNKLKEIKQIADDLGLNIHLYSLNEFKDIKEVEEDGESFEQNAVKKAKGYYSQIGLPVLSEDSGLCVKALHGQPGVYSSRFAGDEKNDYKNNLKLLELMKGIKHREAKFICVACLVLKENEINTFRGELNGYIAEQMRGQYGFGYDPVFIPQGYDKTLAELGPEVKNKISHRRKAIEKALLFWSKTLLKA
jgi:XTP/dITP diphosphohydrolase